MIDYGGIDPYGYNDPYLGMDLIPPRPKDRDEQSIGIIKELSARKVLETLRHNLVGEFYDSESKKWEKTDGFEPLLNEYGRAKYIQIASSVVSDLVTFSNYREEEIPNLVKFVMKSIIPVMHLNYRQWGIKNKVDLPIITSQLFNLTLASFKKAQGAGDRGVIGRTISEQIVARNSNQDQLSGIDKGAGFYSRLNPFLKGGR